MPMRTVTPRDLPALNRLVWAAKGSWGYPTEWLEQWWPDLQVTPELLSRGHSWLAEDEAGIQGFYLILPQEPEWLLDHLWVDPDLQRRGLGRALLADACRRTAEAGRAGLLIDSDPNAEPFYLRCGAERRGSVPAPMPGQPSRVRPQLWLPARSTKQRETAEWRDPPKTS